MKFKTDENVHPDLAERLRADGHAGLIVLRFDSQSRGHVLAAWARVAALLSREPLAGKLWIVDEDGVRVRPGDAPSGG